jgi:DNA-3-methyladenine glycosylase
VPHGEEGAAGGPQRPAGCAHTPAFFARSADEVARDLLGKIIWRDGVGGGRIVEVEAYLPTEDPASHAHRGRTARNAAMFGPPGTIYVFLIYGMHRLLNLVCDGEGVGSAVLLRSFEPLGDTSVLERNRGAGKPLRERSRIARGPGNVGRALGAELGWNGGSLGGPEGLVVLDDGARPELAVTSRLGISLGRELQLRYVQVGCFPAVRSRAAGRQGQSTKEGKSR